MFALETATEAKLVEYFPLSGKDRGPDANPGASLEFTMTLPNTVLSMFDGFLRGFLFHKPAPTVGQTDDMVGDGMTALTKIAERIGQFGWNEELTGYSLVFDHGLAGRSNYTLVDVKLSAFKMQPKPGSVILKFKAEAPDVAEKIHGKLALLKSQSVKITLTPPEVDDGAGGDE